MKYFKYTFWVSMGIILSEFLAYTSGYIIGFIQCCDFWN